MSVEKLKGTGVALVTPFNADMGIDFIGLQRVIDHVTTGGVDYLVVMGSTGEAATTSWEEKIQVLEYVLSHNKKNLPIVFGLGGNNTAQLAEQLQLLKKYPITAILSASPHYNKPSQKGIIAHFQYLADRSSFPIILYNVPSRTASNMTDQTTIELSRHKNIIGMKEASGDLSQCGKIIAGCDPEFLLISGDDVLTLPIITMGGKGVISVIANLLPREFTNLVNTSLSGNLSEAQKIHTRLIPIYDLLSAEGNPVSLKTGMKAKGLIENFVRLPLVKGSEELLQSFKKRA